MQRSAKLGPGASPPRSGLWKESMQPLTHRPFGIDSDSRTFLRFFAISTLCHVLFFGALVFAPELKTRSRPTLSVINVSMVTLPSQAQAPLPGRPPAEVQKTPESRKPRPPEVSTEAAPEKYRKPPEAVSPKPERKVKKSLKKETFKPAEVVKRAITEIEKEVESSRPDPVSRAIDRLKDRVDKTAGPDRPDSKTQEAAGGALGDGAKSKRILELIDIYRVEVAYQIQKNWAFSEQLAKGRTDLVAELAFTIMPNGEIRDIWFDKRSGNDYLDESARKAILKSNPVRPHPAGVVKPFVIVGLRFTPKGVK